MYHSIYYMETSILQQIKKKAARILEPQLLKPGKVLESRVRKSPAITEIELHLPLANIKKWNEVPYIKFRVDGLCFRDYTPFRWDAEKATCSLLIDTAHEGPGSRWARQLRARYTVQYLKIEGTHQTPHPTDLVVGLGDASSLGHLLALQQLTLPATRFDGAVLLNSAHTNQLPCNYFCSPLSTLANQDELTTWLVKQDYSIAHTWFYLTGNLKLVSELRRLLKSLGHPNIRVKGFWS